MKKKMYIQPKMEVANVATSKLMAPGGGSPINGDYDAGPKLAPQRHLPEMPTDTAAVF